MTILLSILAILVFIWAILSVLMMIAEFWKVKSRKRLVLKIQKDLKKLEEIKNG